MIILIIISYKLLVIFWLFPLALFQAVPSFGFQLISLAEENEWPLPELSSGCFGMITGDESWVTMAEEIMTSFR